MNTIEYGQDRAKAIERDASDAPEQLRPQQREPSQAGIDFHTFPLVPADGASTGQVYDMLRADIVALQTIRDPADRLQPAAFMAVNMRGNATYRTGLRQLAPELEAEVRAAGNRESRLHRDELEEAPQRGEPLSRHALDDLESRMAQSRLEELGWRGRDDLDDVMRDLELLARSDWRQAATLWDKYRPDDPDKPIFIDGDDKDAPTNEDAVNPPYEAPHAVAPVPEGAVKDDADAATSPPLRDADSDDKPAFVTPDSLRKRYLIADNKYYFREEEGRVAFEDSGKRLHTEHDDPVVARSMVELADAKKWSIIKVKGSDDFRREVWLAASLREMDVHGYKPSDLDKARLAELQREHLPSARINSIEPGIERERAAAPAAPRAPAGLREKDMSKGAPGDALSPQQRVAVDTLAMILRERGESEQTIAMASALAAKRFQHQRVVVGKLIAHGAAPYQHDADNEESYFVKLQTAAGDKTIWGADLPRALADSDAAQGDEIAIANRGKARVTVQVRERGENGKPTGKVIAGDVDRNSWQVTKLEHMREEAREQLYAAARAQRGQPVVKVFDIAAPRNDQRDVAPALMPDRQRPHEPDVRR